MFICKELFLDEMRRDEMGFVLEKKRGRRKKEEEGKEGRGGGVDIPPPR